MGHLFREIYKMENYNQLIIDKNYGDIKYLFNDIVHRIDGPAKIANHSNCCGSGFIFLFALNGEYYEHFEFAEKTNHLICKKCNEFCKQSCF